MINPNSIRITVSYEQDGQLVAKAVDLEEFFLTDLNRAAKLNKCPMSALTFLLDEGAKIAQTSNPIGYQNRIGTFEDLLAQEERTRLESENLEVGAESVSLITEKFQRMVRTTLSYANLHHNTEDVVIGSLRFHPIPIGLVGEYADCDLVKNTSGDWTLLNHEIQSPMISGPKSELVKYLPIGTDLSQF